MFISPNSTWIIDVRFFGSSLYLQLCQEKYLHIVESVIDGAI